MRTSERYPGELQALVDYWHEDAGLPLTEATERAKQHLAKRRQLEQEAKS